jgi:hypothetical protein
MIHQPYGGVGGQVSDIEIQANEIFKTRHAQPDPRRATPASRSSGSPRTPTATVT